MVRQDEARVLQPDEGNEEPDAAGHGVPHARARGVEQDLPQPD